MNKKYCLIDAEFEKTLRQKYPFARSVYQATRLLNDEIKYTIGAANDKIFKVKKR